MLEDIQQKQIENINSSLESKGNFLDIIKSSNYLTQTQKDKIISFYLSLGDNNKDKFEIELIENLEILSAEFENVFLSISKKYGKKQSDIQYQTEDLKTKLKQEDNLITKQEEKIEQSKRIGVVDTAEKIEEQKDIKNDKNKKNINEEFNDAKKTIEKFYELFGGKDGLDKKLQEYGIDVGGLKNKAEESVKKDNPDINEDSDEFKSKVEISFIANNKSQISSVLPEDKKQQFEDLYRDIVTSATKLGVDCPQKIDHGDNKKYGSFDKERIIISERQEIAFSIPDNTDVRRKGGIISYEKDGYLVEIDINERPPERHIKGEGIDIKVKNNDIRYESRYEFIVKRRKIEGEIKGIKEYLSNNKGKVEQLKSSNLNLERDFNTRLENFKRGIYLERTESGQLKPINLPAPQNREVAEQGLKEDYEKIMKDRQILKTYEKQEKLLEQKEQEFTSLKKAEQESIYRFKKAIQERDEIAKSNIKYLTKTHLNIFGENNIDRIIELFNKYRDINGDVGARTVNINNGFRDSDKSIIINGMSNLLGGIKYFKNINEPIDYIDGKLVDNRFIVDKLVSTGILRKDRTTVDFNKVEELLKTGKSPKQERQTPKKDTE